MIGLTIFIEIIIIVLIILFGYLAIDSWKYEVIFGILCLTCVVALLQFQLE